MDSIRVEEEKIKLLVAFTKIPDEEFDLWGSFLLESWDQCNFFFLTFCSREVYELHTRL